LDCLYTNNFWKAGRINLLLRCYEWIRVRDGNASFQADHFDLFKEYGVNRKQEMLTRLAYWKKNQYHPYPLDRAAMYKKYLDKWDMEDSDEKA
jgi:hypothetical protein